MRTAPEQQKAATPLMSTRAAVYELGDRGSRCGESGVRACSRRGCWRGAEVFGQVWQAGVGDARVDWCGAVVVEEDRP